TNAPASTASANMASAMRQALGSRQCHRPSGDTQVADRPMSARSAATAASRPGIISAGADTVPFRLDDVAIGAVVAGVAPEINVVEQGAEHRSAGGFELVHREAEVISLG